MSESHLSHYTCCRLDKAEHLEASLSKIDAVMEPGTFRTLVNYSRCVEKSMGKKKQEAIQKVRDEARLVDLYTRAVIMKGCLG